MKTTTNSKQGIFKFLTILKQTAPLVFALAMCSCASTGQVSSTKNPEKTPLVSIPSGWYQAKKNPPAYYPKGFSANSSTGMEDGEWVYAGANGERWFIPKDGIRGKSAVTLYQQALSYRTTEQLAGKQLFLEKEKREAAIRGGSTLESNVAAADALNTARKTAVTTVLSPLFAGAIVASILYDQDPDDHLIVQGIYDLWDE